jgi:CDP-diacylglycerol--serine O-phosphatidyltransferase
MSNKAPKPEDQRERIPFYMLLPNLATISGMCLGITAIRYAIEERFEIAVTLILISGVFDGLDGLLARRLNAASDFGAELDSLSDFLCFGVAPGLIVYEFFLRGQTGISWIFVLVYITAACLRLARFNVTREKKTGDGKSFTGVPAPAGAMLGLLPLFLTMSDLIDLRENPILVAIWLGIVGFLMISQIKTFSPKSIRVPRKLVSIAMFGVVICIGLFIAQLWRLMVVIDVIYLASVLWAVIKSKGRVLS